MKGRNSEKNLSNSENNELLIKLAHKNTNDQPFIHWNWKVENDSHFSTSSYEGYGSAVTCLELPKRSDISGADYAVNKWANNTELNRKLITLL